MWGPGAMLLLLLLLNGALSLNAGSHSVERDFRQWTDQSDDNNSKLHSFGPASPCDPTKWKGPVDGKYQTTGHIDPSKLNVHLIAHTHDDPGWLITVDEYYMQRVQYILDTVVVELEHNPDRRFVYVEQSFFQRWWNEQGHEMKNRVKKLVKEGRLDLTVNGGWVMHDEAAVHYTAMIDQTALGHQFLKDEFDVTPRIGWQIDPFGHSSTHGSLLSEGVGFDALYFARIDYQDYARRMHDKDMEFIWRPSKSRGSGSQVFTGVIQNHYGAPDHFHFQRDAPVQDDPALHDYNVCDIVDAFVKECKLRASFQKGNHLFLTMGDDFEYTNARVWFKNLDKLVHYVNQEGQINVLYSNLSYYTDLKREEGLVWSVKTDDFFPYGSWDHAYWSGYFTSRPALKRFARVSNALLQQIRQIDAIYQSHHPASLTQLSHAVGLVQHHDGISGTEKQAVADDYALRLNDGVIQAQKGFNEVLFVIGEKNQYDFCLLRNQSICDVSTRNAQFEVFVHNSLARTTVETISIPIKSPHAAIAGMSAHTQLLSQYVVQHLPIHPSWLEEAPYTLVFTAKFEPLADYRFLVEQSNTPKADMMVMRHLQEQLQPTTPRNVIDESPTDDAVITLENDFARVTINKNTGSLVTITNKKKQTTIPITSTFYYYHAYGGEGQKSGAYIFRPTNGTASTMSEGKSGDLPQAKYIEISVEDESGFSVPNRRAAFKIVDWATVQYILDDEDEYVQIQWTIGPIPTGLSGREVILRLDTLGGIKSNGRWYTDSNGLEFIERRRNWRPSWNLTIHDDQEFAAANYFPITLGAYINDQQHQLNVVTDRAQGVASLKDGQMEIMLHRRIFCDDSKGVDEALNERETHVNPITKEKTTDGLVVRGTFYVSVDKLQDAMQSMRSKMEKQFYEPLVALRRVTKETDEDFHGDDDEDEKAPWLKVNEFPENVGLTTLLELSKECVMVRLTHLFSVDEHTTLSKPVGVDFTTLFEAKNAKLTQVTELSLTGVTEVKSEDQSVKDKWQVGISGDMPTKRIPLKGSTVTLQPMEVRTFKLCFGKAM